MKDYNFISIKNLELLGEASLGNGISHLPFNTLHPGLSFKNEITNKLENNVFITGYACKNKGFHNEQLKIGHIILIEGSMNFKEVRYSGGKYIDKHTTLDLILSNKSNNLNRRINFRYRDIKNQFYPSVLDYINFLNKIIDLDIDLDLINEKNLSEDFTIQEYEIFSRTSIMPSIIESLTKVEIKSINKSKWNPGKDNTFWIEYEVNNLNHNDKYIKKCLSKSLSEAMDFLLNDSKYSAWSPSHSDIIEMISNSEKQLIEFEAYHLFFYKYFNEQDHLISKYLT